VGTLGALNCHRLDYDRAILIAGQGWMSQGGCGKDPGPADVVRKVSSFARRTAEDGCPHISIFTSEHHTFSETPCEVRGGRMLVRGPSTPHVLSLRESTCSAQDDKSVYGSHVVRQD
jgi:hypothetical protein